MSESKEMVKKAYQKPLMCLHLTERDCANCANRTETGCLVVERKSEKSIDLRPCPFCGGKAEVRKRKFRYLGWHGKDFRIMYQVKCAECGSAVGKFCPNKNQAEELWNRRYTNE